jgi:hypothetical protein
MERSSWGFSLFCDDIRPELGGKYSIMGVYQVDMILMTPPPFVAPKFGILVKYFETLESRDGDLSLKIYMPGDQKDAPTITMPVPRAEIGPSPPDLDADQERIFAATIPVVLAPFVIAKEGFIKVRMSRGDVVTNLGSLKIRQIGSDEKIPGVNA